MLGAVLASAAANKAASVGIGLSVLVGAAGTAEVTGIGPVVREIAVPSNIDGDETEGIPDDEPLLILADDETNGAELASEEDEDADHEADGREHSVVAAADGPGNLVWHQEDGEFRLRGLLVEVGGSVVVRTAGAEGELTDLAVEGDDLDLQVPGGLAKDSDEAPDIEDLVGHLVTASGECTEIPMTEGDIECTINKIRILGNAGQPDAEEDTESAESLSADDAEADLDEDEDDEGPDEGKAHGKPEHPRGPKDKSPANE